MRAQRFGFLAKRAIELAQEIGAETRGKRCARQIEDIVDAFQSHACQRGDRIFGQTQGGKRERGEQLAFAAFGRDHGAREMSRCPRCADGGSNGSACGETEAFDPPHQIMKKFILAAEKMRAAGDIEQNPIRRIAGDKWCVALTRIGQGFEKAGISGLIFRDGSQRRMHGARLRKRESGGKAHAFGCAIDGDEQIKIAAPSEYYEGSLFSIFCRQSRRVLRSPGFVMPRPHEAVGR